MYTTPGVDCGTDSGERDRLLDAKGFQDRGAKKEKTARDRHLAEGSTTPPALKLRCPLEVR